MSKRSSKESSALPFEVKRGFNAMPNAVSDLYVRHPRFTPATERIYRYLLRRHNAEYGYAWPSYKAIMQATNTASRGTISSALESLEHLELIVRFKHENDGAWDNNGYRFKAPIEDEAEFYRRFGAELSARYRRKDGERDSDTLADWL